MENQDLHFQVFVDENEGNGRLAEEATDDPQPMNILDRPMLTDFSLEQEQSLAADRGDTPYVRESDQQEEAAAAVSRSRKRQRNPQLWKSNVRKRQREAGEEYEDRFGKKRRGKQIGGYCRESCRFKCNQHVTEEERVVIHAQFWKLSDEKKHSFYGKFIDYMPKSRCRTNAGNDSRRKFTLRYNFQVKEERVRVCKEFFIKTLDVSQRRVQYFFQNIFNTKTGVPRSPLKGKGTKSHVSVVKKQEVRDHINSFPRVESHYCRANTTCEYVDMFLSIKEMYRLYIEVVENPVKESMYRAIFNNEFNIRFHQRKKDRCDHCEEAKAQGENMSEKLKASQELHIKNKQKCKKERDTDRLSYGKDSDGTTAVICFDLENVFSLPRAEISNFFYKRKLSCYNLTAHCSLDKKSYNAIWHECISGRGGNHIASALIKILHFVIQDHPDITKLILWSDACVPQNRNSIMSVALKQFLCTVQDGGGNLKIIEQKFSEPGHGNIQEVDNIHSQIEKWLESREVFSPVSLLRSLVQLGRRANMQFIQMKGVDFLNFQAVSTQINLKNIPYTKVKHLFYSVDSIGTLSYRESFDDNLTIVKIWRSKSGRQGKNKAPDKLIDNLPTIKPIGVKPPLSLEKKKDIQAMFRYMNDEDKAFYNTIMHA